jgi:hypothetical protein
MQSNKAKAVLGSIFSTNGTSVPSVRYDHASSLPQERRRQLILSFFIEQIGPEYTIWLML